LKHEFILASAQKKSPLKKDENKTNKIEYFFYSLLIVVSYKNMVFYGKNFVLFLAIKIKTDVKEVCNRLEPKLCSENKRR